jgi:hypothetical protein
MRYQLCQEVSASWSSSPSHQVSNSPIYLTACRLSSILKSHMTSHPSLFPTYLLTGILSTSPTSDAMDVDPPPDSKPTDDAEGEADIGMQEELRMTQPEITSLHVLSKVREEKVPRRGVWLVGADKLQGP